MQKYVSVLACVVATSAVQAEQIQISLTGVLQAREGIDFEGFDDASFSLSAVFDGDATWQNRFNFPAAVAMTSNLNIGGSDLVLTEDLAFYPTYAGVFGDPTGLELSFTAPGGSLMLFTGFFTAAPGAADAVIGGDIEFDDFDGATFLGTGDSVAVLDTAGGDYRLVDSLFTVSIVPAPAGALLLGLGGCITVRRRR